MESFYTRISEEIKDFFIKHVIKYDQYYFTSLMNVSFGQEWPSEKVGYILQSAIFLIVY